MAKTKTKRFTGLRKYEEGGTTIDQFYPSNVASGNMLESSFGDGKKPKLSKTAKRNNKSRPCLNCHVRNT